MHALRTALRKNPENAAYASDQDTAAYMLTYFPNYSIMAHDALCDVVQVASKDLKLVTVCGGPQPEVLGLAAALGNDYTGVLDVTNVDLNAQAWEWASTISAELVPRVANKTRLKRRSVTLDLRLRWSAEDVDAIGSANVYTFQHCWNEMYCETSIDNCIALADRAKTGALFCFLENANYNVNDEALRGIQKLLAKRGFTVLHDEREWRFDSQIVAPSKIVNEFFDGLRLDADEEKPRFLPKKYTVQSLIMRKDR
jgi:hypothetical protein